jgi:hypothetical protein
MVGGLLLMPSGKLYHCPYFGCKQTSSRQWNLDIHIKRKHGAENLASAPIIESRLSEVRNRLGITEKVSGQLGMLIITIKVRIALEPIRLQEKKKLLEIALLRRLVKLLNLCA